MRIGVPREIKDHENRVSLTPRAVASLVSSGSKVIVEKDAGARSGFSDSEYLSAGAEIAPDAAQLYSRSDLVVKVKELQVTKGEHKHILARHVIFGYNHFESSRELTEAAIGSGATFISFEKVADAAGQTPLLMPMSRIAGTLAGVWAGFFHNYAFRHDRSLRMKAGFEQTRARFIENFERIINAKVDGALACDLSLQDRHVVIFGGGTVGEMAARICHALGAKLTIVEKRDSRRKYLHELGLGRCSAIASADYDLLKGASAVIGATYDREKADRVVDEKTLKEASEVRKKVIIDVSVDQGGNFPFIDVNGRYAPESMGTIMSPAQLDSFGNVFVRVPNMPSIVPRYASSALAGAIVDYVRAIASGAGRPELARATGVSGGKILDEAVARAHGMPYTKAF